jgi:N-terminal barrel of NtMGAM and CtMGAM, maltase-glucoamylase
MSQGQNTSTPRCWTRVPATSHRRGSNTDCQTRPCRCTLQRVWQRHIDFGSGNDIRDRCVGPAHYSKPTGNPSSKLVCCCCLIRFPPLPSETHIHLKITDASSQRYEVPEAVLPRPPADTNARLQAAQLNFTYSAAPFSFNISRASTGEFLFTTASHPLIFEPQYLRMKTTHPTSANIYGLGAVPTRPGQHDTHATRTASRAARICTGVTLCTLSTAPAAPTPCCFSARQGWTSNSATTSRRPPPPCWSTTSSVACSTFTFWQAARPIRLRLRGSMHKSLGCPLRCRTGRLACTSADMDTKVSASRLSLRNC